MNRSSTNRSLVIRGRRLSETDILQVRDLVEAHRHRGRTAISRELSQLWDWRQPNGKLKERACRSILVELERKGFVDLPAARRSPWLVDAPSKEPMPLALSERGSDLQAYQPLRVERIQQADQARRWKDLMHSYHYLGYRPLVGMSVKYFVWGAQGELLAATGWQSAVERLGCRDQLIGWSRAQRGIYLNRLANNVRFLMLPGVRIAHAASSILSRCLRELKRDWKTLYGVDLWCAETFINPRRFKGICYQAANWIRIGQSRGFSKRGGTFIYHGHVKEVYLYVIEPRLRQFLQADKNEPLLNRAFLLKKRDEFRGIKRRSRMKEIQTNWTPKPPPHFELKAEEIERLAEELKVFHKPFEEVFIRSEQRELSQLYLHGLLSDVERKNMEAMALKLGGPQTVRSVQRFMSEYKWDEDRLRDRYWEESAKTLSRPDGVLSVDSSEIGKKGVESVGVAPQYCGSLGKVANCQSGVFVCYTSSVGHLLLDAQLYLPGRWFSEEYDQRRKQCRVPSRICFQTKPEIAQERIKALCERNLFSFRWITCDGSFGNNEAFLNDLPPSLYYLADISSRRKVWLKEPAGDSRWSRAGCTVAELVAAEGLLEWKHEKVAEGEKGPIVADFVRLRVYVQQDRHPESERWLFVRNEEGGKIKYALSNAPEQIPFKEMVRVSALRWPIERCFAEDKGELGMDQYEHRSWPAWHRHMLMVFLAQFFLLRMKLKFKKKPPRSPCPNVEG